MSERRQNIYHHLAVDEIEEDYILVPQPSRSKIKRNRFSKNCQIDEEIVSLAEGFDQLGIQNMTLNGEKDSKKSGSKTAPTGADNWKAFLQTCPQTTNTKPVVKPTQPSSEVTGERQSNCLAIDCEMVGIGPDSRTNMLARVSIVNSTGHCIYDTFVKPTSAVTDYRTPVSGVRPQDLEHAEQFAVVRQKVLNLINKKVLVGHAIHNDMDVLKIRHPRSLIRDTSKFSKFRSVGSSTPGLKMLTSHFLNVDIQNGEHNSIQDAQATMQLYMLHRKEWEAEIKRHRHLHNNHRSQVKRRTIRSSAKK